MGWIFSISWLVLTAGAAVWAFKTPSDTLSWGRGAVVLTAICFAAALLGIFWQPPLTAGNELQKAIMERGGALPLELSCADAERFGPELARLTDSKVKLVGAGDVLMPAEVWDGMSSGERSALVKSVIRAKSCLNKAPVESLRIIDAETGGQIAEFN